MELRQHSFKQKRKDAMRFDLGPDIMPIGIDSEVYGDFSEDARRGSLAVEAAFIHAELCDEQYLNEIGSELGFGARKDKRYTGLSQTPDDVIDSGSFNGRGRPHDGIVSAINRVKSPDIH